MNFLALLALKPHIFMCGALELSGIVRANVRLNIAIPMVFWSLISGLLPLFLLPFGLTKRKQPVLLRADFVLTKDPS